VKVVWQKIQKKIPEIGASDCTNYFPFSTKRIIEKAFLEPKLLNLIACSSTLTKLPHLSRIEIYLLKNIKTK
jgi:hypothetical protein